MKKRDLEKEKILYNEAYKAYAKQSKELGGSHMEPSRESTIYGRKYVYLYNSHELLCKYDYINKIIVN